MHLLAVPCLGSLTELTVFTEFTDYTEAACAYGMVKGREGERVT